MHSKKHLSFSAIQGMIADKFANAQDTRAPNASNSIKDTMLSGLACMYFQSDSLLEFQRAMERRQQRNNLRSMFSVQNLPTDQGIRNVIYPSPIRVSIFHQGLDSRQDLAYNQ